jgi:predicted nucleic acid-binding protein
VPRLKRLLKSVSTVDAPQGLKFPQTIRLEPKDQPVLLAAINGNADYLLTGDADTTDISTESESRVC